MAVRIVIQARVGSSRLPGKILMSLAGRPLLEQVVRRLQAVEPHLPFPLQFIVATTTDDGDDATAALCEKLGIGCYRGSRDDVLARFVAAVEDMSDDDTLVRATADNPLYCPLRAAAIIQHHHAAAADYTCVRDLSYVVPEVIRVGALHCMAREVDGAPDANYCREHVTPYFRQPWSRFRVETLPADWRGLRPAIRLTVDTPDEYAAMSRIFEAFPHQQGTMSLEEVYGLCQPSQPTRQPFASRPTAFAG